MNWTSLDGNTIKITSNGEEIDLDSISARLNATEDGVSAMRFTMLNCVIAPVEKPELGIKCRAITAIRNGEMRSNQILLVLMTLVGDDRLLIQKLA